MLRGLLKHALFVLFVGVVQILHGYVVVVVEPVHDERLEPGAVVGHVVFLYRAHVLIVEELDAEVKIHVLRTLDCSVLDGDFLMLLQGDLQIFADLVPHGDRAQIADVELVRKLI